MSDRSSKAAYIKFQKINVWIDGIKSFKITIEKFRSENKLFV
jgi:hypothetical protein